MQKIIKGIALAAVAALAATNVEAGIGTKLVAKYNSFSKGQKVAAIAVTSIVGAAALTGGVFGVSKLVKAVTKDLPVYGPKTLKETLLKEIELLSVRPQVKTADKRIAKNKKTLAKLAQQTKPLLDKIADTEKAIPEASTRGKRNALRRVLKELKKQQDKRKL